MQLKDFEQHGCDWLSKAHDAEGGWRIEVRDNSLVFRLDESFRTDWGPDVKVYLTRQWPQEIGIRDQLADSGTLIETLQAFEGAQDYTLPDTRHFADFRAIMLHCERYSAVWCGVEINAG